MSSALRYFSLLALIAACGCGSGTETADQAVIEGSVVWNGEPVSDGVVTFIPSETRPGVSFNSIPAQVTDGKFQVTSKDGALAGPYRVEVRAFRKTGKMTPEPSAAMKKFDPRLKSEEIKEQIIPPEFNEQSKLTNQLEPGPNQLDFDLKGREIRANLRSGRS